MNKAQFMFNNQPPPPKIQIMLLIRENVYKLLSRYYIWLFTLMHLMQNVKYISKCQACI